MLLPLGAAGAYLYRVAADQYASRLAFSVQREESAPALEMLGGLSELTGAGRGDTEVLFAFIRSQRMVRVVDARLDLERLYSGPDDPLFALAPGASVEALTAYWRRMVDVSYDSGAGLVSVRVLGFAPGAAQAVARAIEAESAAMIGGLSDRARQEAMARSEEELARARSRLRESRQALTAFRGRHRMLDPGADVAGRMGLVSRLEAQLAQDLIDLDLLEAQGAGEGARAAEARRRVAAIRARIATERARFGAGDPESDTPSDPPSDPRRDTGPGAYASLMETYEGLAVDLEFAEESYLAARAAQETARAEARRRARFLAVHIPPTLAESPEYPRRALLLGLLAALLGTLWGVGTLTAYALRDRG